MRISHEILYWRIFVYFGVDVGRLSSEVFLVLILFGMASFRFGILVLCDVDRNLLHKLSLGQRNHIHQIKTESLITRCMVKILCYNFRGFVYFATRKDYACSVRLLSSSTIKIVNTQFLRFFIFKFRHRQKQGLKSKLL